MGKIVKRSGIWEVELWWAWGMTHSKMWPFYWVRLRRWGGGGIESSGLKAKVLEVSSVWLEIGCQLLREYIFPHYWYIVWRRWRKWNPRRVQGGVRMFQKSTWWWCRVEVRSLGFVEWQLCLLNQALVLLAVWLGTDDGSSLSLTFSSVKWFFV